jgi:hypothetical protein
MLAQLDSLDWRDHTLGLCLLSAMRISMLFSAPLQTLPHSSGHVSMMHRQCYRLFPVKLLQGYKIRCHMNGIELLHNSQAVHLPGPKLIAGWRHTRT